jgi:MYXO-CTERM domain-containing protein
MHAPRRLLGSPRWYWPLLVLALAAVTRPARAQGTWTQAPRNAAAGGGAFGLWLLTDGRVLSHGSSLKDWVILTPDRKGSYANGTWKSVAGSAHARGGATQHVLKDGRFFQAGGEYIDGPACTAALCPTAEIYDPIANTWTNAASAPYDVGDTGSATLGDGRLLYSTRAGNMIQIYDPTTDAWTKSGTMPLSSGVENAWAVLQNGGILAVGFNSDGAAIYNPSKSSWKRTGAVPSGFNTGDTGGITMMFDGRVFVYGLNFHSYIYSPGATADDAGSWVEGPKLLDTEAEDEYSDILPNGLVMGGLVHVMFGPGTVLQLFDPTAGTVSKFAPPANDVANVPIDYVNLPNGQVMVTGSGADYLLTLDTGPDDAWRPTVTSVVYDGSTKAYTLTGTQISGLVSGADEGDDMTMAENYPIVWLTDASGDVYYCRTFNFSNMMPSKGSAPETCDFTTPADLPDGSYSLYVSAVGVPSKDPFPFTVGQSSMPAGSGGMGGLGGAAATGGAGASGFGGASAGSGAAGASVGGAAGSGTVGSGGSSGLTSVAGTAGGDGRSGSGGTGGLTGSSGTLGSGGSSGGAAGSVGTAGSGGGFAAGGMPGTATGGSSGAVKNSSGCSCRAATSSSSRTALPLALLGLGMVFRRRHRRSR